MVRLEEFQNWMKIIARGGRAEIRSVEEALI